MPPPPLHTLPSPHPTIVFALSPQASASEGGGHPEKERSPLAAKEASQQKVWEATLPLHVSHPFKAGTPAEAVLAKHPQDEKNRVFPSLSPGPLTLSRLSHVMHGKGRCSTQLP